MRAKASVKKYEERRQRQRQRLKKNEQRSKSQEAGCCVRPVFAGGDLGELAGEGGRGRMVDFLTSNLFLRSNQRDVAPVCQPAAISHLGKPIFFYLLAKKRSISPALHFCAVCSAIDYYILADLENIKCFT